jgi:hypothetical protein
MSFNQDAQETLRHCSHKERAKETGNPGLETRNQKLETIFHATLRFSVSMLKNSFTSSASHKPWRASSRMVCAA